MLQKGFKSAIICSAILILGINKCFADDAFSPLNTTRTDSVNIPSNSFSIDLDRQRAKATVTNVNESESFYHLSEANDKFVECNVRASWEDFKSIINNSFNNDFMYMSFANKMADLGLFDLADLAISKIQDKDLTNISTDAMKRFYYPRKKLKLDTELSLAEAYSNIIYNNQSSEATNDLLKNEQNLANYDYANYLIALGSYKSSFFSRAAKYINLALLQNPNNLNYQKLKAQILVENDEPEEAIKIVENLKKQDLYSYEYEKKINSLEQFILYKTKKAQWEKDYHLAYYYYLENDSSKAIRTLESTLSSRKKGGGRKKAEMYALMGKIYFNMYEFEKAADNAKKANKINNNNSDALITLGDLSYRAKNYKQALNYYKQAASSDKKSYLPLVKEAQTYQQLANNRKSEEIYIKVLKTYSDSWEAYYNIALLDKDKRTIYLKKALAINPLFENAWLELAKTDIEKGNYDIAQTYLANALYIDENDFRYYYYQGLINNNAGDFVQAKYNFKKCLKLNSDFDDAKKALENIPNSEPNNPQDSI